MKEVGYVGHLLTAEGLRTDPEKVHTIVGMKTPENVKVLQQFLGMVRYISKFVPQLSELTLPPQHLTHADVTWVWDDVHQIVFENALTSQRTVYYPFRPSIQKKHCPW